MWLVATCRLVAASSLLARRLPSRENAVFVKLPVLPLPGASVSPAPEGGLIPDFLTPQPVRRLGHPE